MTFYDNKIFSACIMENEFWIRFRFLKNSKYDGFRVINTNKKQLRFSERNGYSKTTQIFNFNFKKLRPFKI